MRISDGSSDVCSSDLVGLDREIGAVVLGGFRPGGADFGFADKDAVARRVAAGIAIGDDANLFRLHRKGDDLALIFAGGGLREAADLGHDAILSLGSSRTSAASMRIGGQQGDGAAARRARSAVPLRSEEHTSELQSLMRISY